MEKISQEALNTAFSEMLDSPDEAAALQEAGLTYIKQRLREESFARKILPPQNITRFDTQRAVDSDTVEKIIDIEPHSTALALNFRSNVPAQFVEGARYRVPFYMISTPLYQKTEQELYAYEMPILKIIEDNSVKDIQETEDSRFISYCQMAVEATNQILQITDADVFSDKRMMTESFKLLDTGNPTAATPNRLHTSTILMNTGTYNDILGLPTEQIGDSMAGTVFRDGFAYHQLFGKKLIITTKNDLVQNGQVWLFAEQRFLGNFFVLNNTRFYIEKEADLIKWKTWEIIGMGLGNINGIAKLEFGNGITSASTDAVVKVLADIT